MAQADFLNTITNVLVLSLNQRGVLSDDAYDMISTIINFDYENIREWCTTKSKLKTTRGRYYYGDLKINCLQALAWWAIYLTLRGKHIFLAEFDSTMMAYCMCSLKLD